MKFHQHETAAQFFAVEAELDFAMLHLIERVELALHFVGSAIPHHHRSRAIAALRNLAFEAGIVERVVLGLDCQPLVTRIQRRPFGYGPGFERAVYFEAEVIVQAASGVFLDHEGISGRGLGFIAGWLWGLIELALAAILLEAGHDWILSQVRAGAEPWASAPTELSPTLRLAAPLRPD